MSKKIELNKEDYACNSYEQGNPKCKSCLRFIGFMSEHNKWKEYHIHNNHCEGYLEKNKVYN